MAIVTYLSLKILSRPSEGMIPPLLTLAIVSVSLPDGFLTAVSVEFVKYRHIQFSMIPEMTSLTFRYALRKPTIDASAAPATMANSRHGSQPHPHVSAA